MTHAPNIACVVGYEVLTTATDSGYEFWSSGVAGYPTC
jgi:hypothetical protein